MSTFGGDEIIIAAAVMNSAKFKPTIVTLRDRCRQWLPRTVSFGIAVVTPDTPGLSEHLHAPLRIANLVLAGVDRALFTHKSARRRNEGEEGFVVDIDLDLRTVGHVIS